MQRDVLPNTCIKMKKRPTHVPTLTISALKLINHVALLGCGLGVNTLCLVLSHNYVITINQYLNQCLHLVLVACILSDEKARKTFYKKVAMCSDGGEWRDIFHFSSNN